MEKPEETREEALKNTSTGEALPPSEESVEEIDLLEKVELSPEEALTPFPSPAEKLETSQSEIKNTLPMPVKFDSSHSKQLFQEKSALAAPLPQAPQEPIAPLSLEVELSFLLGHQSILLQDVKSLVEGKVIPLGGTQFQATIMLQENIIAQAELVMVEGVPSLQITKTISVNG
jgi:flagellar motor switch/type III secretory pathway protein FliN